MKLHVYALGQRRYEPVLKIHGISGKPFLFRWNPGRGCYMTTVESQSQMDDLMETQRFQSYNFFSVIVPEGDENISETTVQIVEKVVIKEIPAAADAKIEPRDRPPLPFKAEALGSMSREELKNIAITYGLSHLPSLRIDSLQHLIEAYIAGYEGKLPTA